MTRARNRSARQHNSTLTGLVLLLAAPGQSACTATGEDSSPGVDATASAAGATGAGDASIATPSVGGDATAGRDTAVVLPSAHVPAVARNPADDRVYLATHDGLFRYEAGGPVRFGPVIDLTLSRNRPGRVTPRPSPRDAAAVPPPGSQ